MAPSKTGVKNTKVFDYCANKSQKLPMHERELPGQMEASIRLSKFANNISSIIGSIKKKFPDFECEQKGDVIVVSGCPPRNDFVADEILKIVQMQDRHAAMHK